MTFFYTTGKRMRRAHTLHDLVLSSSERRTLWHTLRERAQDVQAYRALPQELPPDVLVLLQTWLLELDEEKGNG